MLRPRIEAGLEADVELGEVRVQTELGVRARRIDSIKLDQPRGQESLDHHHRIDELRALGRVERREKRPGKVIAEPVEQRPLRQPLRSQAHRSHPLVLRLPLYDGHAGPLQ